MKTITFTICSVLTAILICLTSCQRNEVGGDFEYVDATVNDLVGKEFEAILFRNFDDPDNTNFIAIIGEIDDVEKIVQHKIITEKVIDTSWVKRIASGFQNAERQGIGCMDNFKAIFITKTRGYMITFLENDKLVYGPDFQSEQLWKNFKEIGLEEESEPVDMEKIMKGLERGSSDMNPNKTKEAQGSLMKLSEAYEE